MKRSRFLPTVAVIMLGASFCALLLSLVIILVSLGRPDHALLRTVGEVASLGIDCSAPAHSPLFRSGPSPVISSQVPPLDYLLVDGQGQELGKRWTSGAIPDYGLREVGSERTYVSMWNDLRSKPQVSWVALEGICHADWRLIVHDPTGTLFRQLMFRRQAVLYFSSCSVLSLVVFVMAYYLLRKGREARAVMVHLRSGNLKARLPSHRFERFLDLVTEFNNMVAAIESLVQKIQTHEKNRLEWLGDLAHDLRTPLASLSAAIETLSDFDETIKGQQRQQLFASMLDDITYFHQLLDDIFFLAFLQGTRRPLVKEQFALDEFLEKLMPQWRELALTHGHEFIWEVSPGKDFRLWADPHLLRRLLQNIVDNALRYAKTRVRFSLMREGDSLVFLAVNDSAEIVPADLQAWGRKRQQRRISENPSRERTSLGLGSSIIQQIARLHQGHAKIEQTKTGEYFWVTVTLSLPVDFKDTGRSEDQPLYGVLDESSS